MSNPTIDAFLKQNPIPFYINGKWVQSEGGDTLATINPATGQVLAMVSAGDARDVDRAVSAANAAFGKWAKMDVKERAVILHRLSDLIDRDLEILAELESLDVGKPVAQPRAFDIPHTAQTFRYYTDLSVHTRYREPIAISGFEARTYRAPVGVCGFVFPWNFPFLLLGWGVAPALAAGNTVVIKPAEITPLTTLYFCKLAEEAGVPPGVINVINGTGATAGEALASHPGLRHFSFTGSPEVGRKVAEACGRNLVPVKLELGGKGAAVIFDDVDSAATAQALASAITLNAGQVCCTATRWIVQKGIFDGFVQHVTDALKKLKIGPGNESSVDMGPVVSEKQKHRIFGYIEKGLEGGAEKIFAGNEPQKNAGGYFVPPTLLAGSPENICAREEIFGPVAYLMRFDDENDGIRIANGSGYGLANSVWSADLNRANRVAEELVAGNSWINAHNVFAHGIPYGGFNLSGYGGGVLGPDTLDDYFRKQSIVRPLN